MERATTVNDAIQGWKDNGWEDLSPSTVRRYENMWMKHIHGSIGKQRLTTLSPYDVEKYFRRLKADGLAEASVRQIRALMHRACRLARKWSGGVLPNPIADTELPTWALDERNEVRAPTLEEVRTLIATADKLDPSFAAVLRLVAATGMRRGEVCALRWNDIDLSAGTVRISQSVVAAKGGAILKSPKTRASIRTVAIDSDTASMLKRLQLTQRSLAMACGLTLEPEAFLFSSEPGGLGAASPGCDEPHLRHRPGRRRRSPPTCTCTRCATSMPPCSTRSSPRHRSRPDSAGPPSRWPATTPTRCPRRTVELRLTWERCCPQAKPAWLRGRAEAASTYSGGRWSAGVPRAGSPAVRPAVSPLNAGECGSFDQS